MLFVGAKFTRNVLCIETQSEEINVYINFKSACAVENNVQSIEKR